jgi:hypothetical protein
MSGAAMGDGRLYSTGDCHVPGKAFSGEKARRRDSTRRGSGEFSCRSYTKAGVPGAMDIQCNPIRRNRLCRDEKIASQPQPTVTLENISRRLGTTQGNAFYRELLR